MSQIAKLRCRCGEVEGHVTGAGPSTVNRIVCHCDDCQAYLHHLGRNDLLDSHGGSDIVHVAPNTLSFDRGIDRIVGLRLSPKGLYRWYAACCNTPVGSTLKPGVPFVGVLAQTFESPGALFGEPLGKIQGKFAIGTPPKGSVKPNPRVLARLIGKILGWRLRGKAWPNPFFDRATGEPLRPITVLPRAERDALRALCGPRPA